MVMIYNTPEGSSTMQSDRNLVHDAEHHHMHSGVAHSHVCWGAVVAGSVTAISLMILSGSFAYAVGIPGYSGGSYGFSSGLYAILTSMVAFFVGGAVVSYFADRAEQRTGLLHGIMAWALTLPLILVLSTTAFGLFHTYNLSALNHTTMQPAIDQPVASDVRAAAWGAFLALFLGLISAAIGGASGLIARAQIRKVQM